MPKQPFSMRNRYSQSPKKISIREDAPQNLRYFILETAHDLGWGPSSMRDVLCRVLHTPPDPSNWSEYPNIEGEVQTLTYGAPWYAVYDVIVQLQAGMLKSDLRNGTNKAETFTDELNEFFIEEGIGWKLAGGEIVVRGTEAFELIVSDATDRLDCTNRPTAAGHLHEALQDLSRRPKPDLPGAIYHAMGCLEAVARHHTGDGAATLGQILKRYPEIVPSPLDTALSKVWGYASDEARHVREGKEPRRREAELIVGLAAVVAGYLTESS